MLTGRVIFQLFVHFYNNVFFYLYFVCKDTGFILVTHSIYYTNTFTHSSNHAFKRFTHSNNLYFGCKDTGFISIISNQSKGSFSIAVFSPQLTNSFVCIRLTENVLVGRRWWSGFILMEIKVLDKGQEVVLVHEIALD